MKRPTELLSVLLSEIVPEGVVVTRDLSTILRRVSREGFSFLSITLPKLSDAMERGLEDGVFPSSVLSSFKRRRAGSSLPAFMQGLTERIFDDLGNLLESPCIDSILAIRQVCRFYKKMEEPCSPARQRAAEAQYIATDSELEGVLTSVNRNDPILDLTCRFIGRDFIDFDPDILTCRHGPGATAEKLNQIDRYSIRAWPKRSYLFPLDTHALPNMSLFEDLQTVHELDENEEPPVRVVFVPKTATTPRVIAIEPHFMQYMQQSLMIDMVDRIERSPILSHSVHFRDQTYNQEGARRASINRINATIDLSEASDRVSFDLARRVLRYTPYWDYLEQCRSLKAQTPSGFVLKLNKFASMGSATCFPVEAYVFAALCISAMHVHRRTIPTYESVRAYSKEILVYGDDIIAPCGILRTLVPYFNSYGLKINSNKSFSKGSFRESCGADYFKGVSVKPVYARQRLPERDEKWSPSVQLAWCSTRNQLWKLGLWKSSALLDTWLLKQNKRIRYVHFSSYRQFNVGEPSTHQSGFPERDSSRDVLRLPEGGRIHEPNGLVLLCAFSDHPKNTHPDFQCQGVWTWDFRPNHRISEFPNLSGGLLKSRTFRTELHDLRSPPSVLSNVRKNARYSLLELYRGLGVRFDSRSDLTSDRKSVV